MQKLLKHAARKVFLILNKLNVHKAKVARERFEGHANRIEVFYLAPYCPELNPSEYVTCELKGEIQRGVPPKDVMDRQRAAPRAASQKSPEDVRAYFEHRNISYVV